MYSQEKKNKVQISRHLKMPVYTEFTIRFKRSAVVVVVVVVVLVLMCTHVILKQTHVCLLLHNMHTVSRTTAG